MTRALRLLELAQYLNSRTHRTFGDLRDRFHVSERTLFRDLRELEEMHLPIVHEAGQGYRLLSEASLPAMSLTADELALVRVAIAQPALSRQRALRATLKSLESKLARVVRALDETPLALQIAGPEHTGEQASHALPLLEKAIAERRECRIHYLSLAGKSDRWRSLRPYRLFHRTGAWYLAAHCLEHGEPRLFRVDRVSQVEIEDRTFTVPMDFDLDRLLEGAWGVSIGGRQQEIRLRFAGEIAPLLLNACHHSDEEKSVRPDGSVDYSVHLTALDEIARWVLGFGGLAVVVGPRELRDRVVALARGALSAQGAEATASAP